MATTRYTVVNGVVLHEDRNGTERLYRPDTLGSTAALQDATTTKATYVYWPYGEVRTTTGSGSSPFNFVGTLGYYDDGSRLYIRARHYRPAQGRWMTVDPLWPFQAQYAYVGGKVVSNTDYLGLRPMTPLEQKDDCCFDNALLAATFNAGWLVGGALATCLACAIFTAGTCAFVCGPLLLILGAAALLMLLINATLFYLWCMNSPYGPCNSLPPIKQPCLPPTSPDPPILPPPGVAPTFPPLPGTPPVKIKNCDTFATEWCIRHPRPNCWIEEQARCLGLSRNLIT
ncbi:MAG: hypothetical protein JST30_07740 [Armatimonadetes bacterium]|nr:hypothetical protein [Armatimonadota bacterium]